MKFTVGQIVSLKGTHYRIEEQLLSGAVSDVYRASVEELSGIAVIIKLVRADADLDTLRIEGLQREAEVLTLLNKAEDTRWPERGDVVARLRRANDTVNERRIIALLDNGEVSDGQPFVIQEEAPPAFERFAITTLADERRLLVVFQAVSNTLALLHKNQLALKDFEPKTKADRFRLRWLDGKEHFEFKLIDWNITGGPEDMAQDLFYFGQHLYFFLRGYYLTLDVDNRPPARLGLGDPDWLRLTEGTRQILSKVLHRALGRRYLSANDLNDDLAWWVDVLRQMEAANALSRLQDKVWQARSQGRFDRAAAASELALRLEPPAESRQAFELWRKQAREELEKEDWQPIAHAYATLLTGAYAKAGDEFNRQLRDLPAESEAARRARLYVQLAAAGDQLKKAYSGTDVRTTSEWRALDNVVSLLITRRWVEAKAGVQEVDTLWPGKVDRHPVDNLRNLVEAGLKFETAVAELDKVQPRRSDADKDNWLAIEQEQIAQYAAAVSVLEKIQQLASQEPDFRERCLAETKLLARRRELFVQYQEIEQLAEQARRTEQEAGEKQTNNDYTAAMQLYDEAGKSFQAALDEVKSILLIDPAQYRAKLLETRLTPQLREAENNWQDISRKLETSKKIQLLLASIDDLIRRGEYTDALSKATQAAEIVPERPDVQQRLLEVRCGAELDRQAPSFLAAVPQYIQGGRFKEAEEVALKPELWDAQPLQSLPGGETLPEIVGIRLFVLRPALREEIARLREQIQRRAEAARRITDAQQRGEYQLMLDELDDLHRTYLATRYEDDLAAAARQSLRRIDQAKESLALGVYLGVLTTLSSGETNAAAKDLRQEAGYKWQRQLAQRWDEGVETDLRAALEVCTGLGVAVQLREMQDTARLMRRLKQAPTAETAEQLAALDADLTAVLKASSEWPPLRAAALEIQNQLMDDWRTRLGGIEKTAQQLIIQKKWAEAAQTAHQAWVPIPTRLQDLIYPAGDGLPALLRDLELRQVAWARLEVLRSAKSFTSVLEQALALDLPKTLRADDLRQMQQALSEAAEGEKLLSQQAQLNTYAVRISECLEWRTGFTGAALLRDKGWAVTELVGKVQTYWRALAKALQERYQQEVKAISGQPAQSPADLLTLYWQIRWLRVVDEEDVALIALPGKAVETWKKVYGAVRQQVSGITGQANLEAATQLAQQLHQLLDGLQNRTLELPNTPTPDDFHPAVTVDVANQAEQLLQTLKAISGLCLMKVSELPDADTLLAKADNQLETTLSLLRQLEVASGETSAAQPEAIDAVRTLIGAAQAASLAIQHAQEELSKENALGGLKALKAQTAVSARETIASSRWDWLLEEALGFLRREYDRFSEQLRTALTAQALIIFKDTPTAASRLNAVMLSQADSPELKKEVRAAVIAAANHSSGYSEKDHQAKKSVQQRGQAKAVWQAVLMAAGGKKGSGDWADLARLAEDQLKALQSIPVWIVPVAGLAALLVILASVFGINEWGFKPQNDMRATQAATEATALFANAAGTSDAMNTQATQAAATQTAQALAGMGAATKTAVAVSATRAAEQTAIARKATADANQAAANVAATAQAVVCRDTARYALTADALPIFSPEPGTIFVTGNETPIIRARWTITNTGECPWEAVTLQTWPGLKDIQANIRFDPAPAPGQSIPPTGTLGIRLSFSPYSVNQPQSWEWVLSINGLLLAQQPHLALPIAQKKPWIIVQTPTPTPPPTPTPLPTDKPEPPQKGCTGGKPTCGRGVSPVCRNNEWVCP